MRKLYVYLVSCIIGWGFLIRRGWEFRRGTGVDWNIPVFQHVYGSRIDSAIEFLHITTSFCSPISCAFSEQIVFL